MDVTLGQAAKALGIGKSTLSRYIAQGKVSAQKQPDGSYRIDAAELDRVRGLLRPHPEPSLGHSATDLETHLLRQEVEQLRDTLVERDRRIADLMQERDAWRRMAERLQPENPRQLPEGLTARHRLWAWFWGKRLPME
jgi:excisionase family DNA binding protein